MARLDDFLNALSAQESGGSYSAVNKHTGAMGRWQVLPSNVRPWAKKYLGINITASQFLRTPALQDRLVKAVLGSYVSKYGYRGAAAAWYSGNPRLENNYNKQKYGPSIGSYVDSVMKRMGSNPLVGAITAVADEAILATSKVAQSLPGAEQDPLQIGQGLLANDAAADNDDPSATKGIGLDIEDGIGSGQSGMNTGFGVDSDEDDPLGLGGGFNDLMGEPSTVGRETVGPVESITGAIGTVGRMTGGAKYLSPLPGIKPSGEWGTYPGSGRKHLALDFAVKSGTKVHAPTGGTVVFAGWDPNGRKTNGGFGLHLRIKNTDGTYVILGHLSSVGGLKVGDKVRANQVIARSGNTGNSTGPHLHMEFRHSAWDPSSAFDFSSMFKW